MVEGHTRGEVALQSLSIANFIPSEQTTDFLRERLVISELGQEWLMEEVLDVFGVVKGGGRGRGFGGLALVARFARVDSYLTEISRQSRLYGLGVVLRTFEDT